MKKLTPEFVYKNEMPINDRIRLIFMIAAIGFAFQLFISPFLGWPVVFAAALLGTMKSRSNKPEFIAQGEWTPVTIEEMEKTNQLLNKTSSFSSDGDGSFAGVSCIVLLAGFFATIVAVFIVDGGSLGRWYLPVIAGGPLSLPIAVDVLTFISTIGFSGWAKAWEPPDLRTKLSQLSWTIASAKSNPELDFQPSLLLAKTQDGMVPMDCRLLVKIKGADPNFIGIQVQVSFNEVRGSRLPYAYCVVLAKREFNITKKAGEVEMPPPGGFPVGFLGLFADENEKREAKFARFHGSLVELKREGDVDIAVVRQDTSKSEGYTTTPNQTVEVFSDAYFLAASMLKNRTE